MPCSLPIAKRQRKYSRLLPHTFCCSDFSREFLRRRGLYSCSACDDFREQHLRRQSQERDQTSLNPRYQCQREKQGRGYLRFRVQVGTNAVSSAVALCSEIIPIDTEEAVQIKKKESAKDRKAKKKKALLAADQERKNENAAKVRESLLQQQQKRELVAKECSLTMMQANVAEMKGAILEANAAKRNLEKACFESKAKAIISESALNVEKRRRLEAEELLKQEKLLTKRLKDQVYYYKKQLLDALKRKNEVVSKNASADVEFLDNLCERIEHAFGIMKGYGNEAKTAKLLELLSSGLLFNGCGISMMESMHRDFVRNVFKPWKLVLSSDMSPAGSFRTATVAGLTEFFDTPDEDDNEFESVDRGKKQRLFPSTSSVARERQALNKYALERIGLRRRVSAYGEVIYVNPEAAIRLMLDAAGLTKYAKEGPVHLAVTSDGANSFRNRTQISIGVKVVDPRGHHCKTKQPLFVDELDDEPAHYRGVQSSEMCTILIMADARDKSKMYDELFGEFYKYAEELQNNGMPASDFGPYLHPFKIVYPSDLKAAWTTAGRGGNCKKTTYFCHLCAATRDELVKFNLEDRRCNRCQRKNRSKCYHHSICDSTALEGLLADLEASLAEYVETFGKQYDDILKNTKLQYDPMMAMKHSCKMHIDYIIPDDDYQASSEYISFIAKECRLRGITINIQDDVEHWRDLLRVSLATESKIALLYKIKKWKEEGVKRVPLVNYVELLIPCILHLENRIGEKIITMILRIGLDFWTGPKKKYVEALECVMQTKVLGTERSPAHWSLPYEGKNDAEFKISVISGRNESIRTMINVADVIIEAALPADQQNLIGKLVLAVSKYSLAIGLLNKHYQLSEEEVEEFQDNCDDFFHLWVEIFGVAGVTNYIHLIGSGHMQYFLKNYGCLYLYSQQGWEALMGKVQAVLHLNTQRGGKGSGGGNKKSYIYPVMLFVLRDLLWKTGDAKKFYLERDKRKRAAAYK